MKISSISNWASNYSRPTQHSDLRLPVGYDDASLCWSAALCFRQYCWIQLQYLLGVYLLEVIALKKHWLKLWPLVINPIGAIALRPQHSSVKHTPLKTGIFVVELEQGHCHGQDNHHKNLLLEQRSTQIDVHKCYTTKVRVFVYSLADTHRHRWLTAATWSSST